jgi:hypothetical protein
MRRSWYPPNMVDGIALRLHPTAQALSSTWYVLSLRTAIPSLSATDTRTKKKVKRKIDQQPTDPFSEAFVVRMEESAALT